MPYNNKGKKLIAVYQQKDHKHWRLLIVSTVGCGFPVIVILELKGGKKINFTFLHIGN